MKELYFSKEKSLFWGVPKSLQMVTAAMKLKDAYSLEGKLWPTYTAYKKQRHYFANKGLSSQDYGFPSSHVWMWVLDYKESWMPKNWCFWTVVLEKTLESPLDCKEIQPVHPKGNSPEYSLEGLMLKVKLQYLWAPDVKNWLIWKDPAAGKDWRQEEKGTTEDEMVMGSPTQWTWVWVNSGSWWWTVRPGLLQSMGLQRVGHNWATELNWRKNLNRLCVFVFSSFVRYGEVYILLKIKYVLKSLVGYILLKKKKH